MQIILRLESPGRYRGERTLIEDLEALVGDEVLAAVLACAQDCEEVGDAAADMNDPGGARGARACERRIRGRIQ